MAAVCVFILLVCAREQPRRRRERDVRGVEIFAENVWAEWCADCSASEEVRINDEGWTIRVRNARIRRHRRVTTRV